MPGRRSLSDQSVPSTPVRVGDAEREEVAERLRTAAADGCLTLTEADERQALAYAAQFQGDLVPLTADLPEPVSEPAAPARGWDRLDASARRRLAIHIGVAAVIAVLLVVRWVMGIGPDDDGAGFDGPGFWSVFPLFWISLSVLFHYRRAQR